MKTMTLPNEVAYESTMYPVHVGFEVRGVQFSTYHDEKNYRIVECEATVRVFCPLRTHDAGFFASAKNTMEIIINRKVYVLSGNITEYPDFHVLECTIDCSIHEDGAYYSSVFGASVSVFTTEEDFVDSPAKPSNHLYLMKRPSVLSCNVQGWKVTCEGATRCCFDLRFKEDKPKGRAKAVPARTLMDRVWVMFFKVCFALFVASILDNLPKQSLLVFVLDNLPKQSLLVFVFFALIAYLALELSINKYWNRMFPIPEAGLGVKRQERLDVLMAEIEQECA
jgi:hypothetical protein